MMIRTRRLLLRPVFAEDAAEVYAGLCDEGIVRMLARAPWPYLPEHARAYCASVLDPLALRFAIALPAERGAPIIGMVGLDQSGEGPELGYWIARGRRRQGYASEAVAGVLDAATVLGKRAVAAGHFVDNPASGNVLTAAGFSETGEIRETDCLGRGGQSVLARRYVCDLSQRNWLRLAA